MNPVSFLQQSGATLAGDGIPLYFGDIQAEYNAALHNAVLMDRSHEGRLQSQGRDRLEIINRISTNDVVTLGQSEGRPTILTNPNGRIIDRLLVFNQDNRTVIFTEPGRGSAVKTYLQRQVFFNDDFQLLDLAPNTRLFTILGPNTDTILKSALKQPILDTNLTSFTAPIGGVEVLFARRKPIAGQQWLMIVPNDHVADVWNFLLETGHADNLIPAGSLAYNALRIRAGFPAVGREISTDYIPLEAGLWDEVSFSKGCYTGQEIIARMESRNRLAKTLVKLQLSEYVEAPAELYHQGKLVGTMTSSVKTPADEILGLGFVKVPNAVADEILKVNNSSIEAKITELAGSQAPMLQDGHKSPTIG